MSATIYSDDQPTRPQMSDPRGGGRTRSVRATIRPRAGRTVATLLVLLLVLCTSSCNREQVDGYRWINETRVATGLHALAPSVHAMDKAQAWAEQLARTGRLEHSDVADGMPAGFTLLGENVGRGGDVAAIAEALMASPAHRANLLDPRFDWVGVGVARDAAGVVYLVQVFARYR